MKISLDLSPTDLMLLASIAKETLENYALLVQSASEPDADLEDTVLDDAYDAGWLDGREAFKQDLANAEVDDEDDPCASCNCDPGECDIEPGCTDDEVED